MIHIIISIGFNLIYRDFKLQGFTENDFGESRVILTIVDSMNIRRRYYGTKESVRNIC